MYALSDLQAGLLLGATGMLILGYLVWGYFANKEEKPYLPLEVADPSQPKKIALMVVAMIMVFGFGLMGLRILYDISKGIDTTNDYLSTISNLENIHSSQWRQAQ